MIAMFLLLFAIAHADPQPTDQPVDPAPTAQEASPAAGETTEQPSAEPSAERPKPVEAGEDLDVDLLAQAINAQAWPVAFGLILTFLVALARKIIVKDRIPKELVPWVCIALSVLATVGAALSSGAAVGSAVLSGLSAGLASIGGWEAIGKHIPALKPQPAKIDGDTA